MTIREIFEHLQLPMSVLYDINRNGSYFQSQSPDDECKYFFLAHLEYLGFVRSRELRVKGYFRKHRDPIILSGSSDSASVDYHEANVYELFKKSNSYHTVKVYRKVM